MSALAVLLFPLITFAQTTDPTVKGIVWKISYAIINPLIQLGFVIALVMFMWKIGVYIRDRNSGYVFDKDGKSSGDGINGIKWALFGLIVMVSAFGIMQLIKNILGSTIELPG